MPRPNWLSSALWACILALSVTLTACGDDEVGSSTPSLDAGDVGNVSDMGPDEDDFGTAGGDAGDSGNLSDMSTMEDMSDMGEGECGNGVVEGGEECDDGNMDDDDDCQTDCTLSCGNGTVEPTEECDTAIADGMPGACPTVCDSGPACTVGMLTGTECSATCAYDPVSTCTDDDGCCGFGCDSTNDNDCDATCGNSVVEPGETCDPVGSCPTACDDGIACTTDTLAGDPATCTAECVFDTITACTDGDGCCAPGCDATNDDDCSVTCGNGAVEGNETCDGNCPTSCTDDGDACTVETLSGDPAQCNVQCGTTTITMAADGDGCCPTGANANTDDDCAAVCSNGVVEAGETCDGNCPTMCTDDGDACTVESLTGSAANCDVACTTTDITMCIDADGCCPSSCDATNDNDCSASCGNGTVEMGETCDGNCPTMCADDGDACTVETLTGSPSNCNVQCTTTTITTPADNDLCCPAGANANTDNDCVAMCGNGAVEGSETCDGNCPTSCASDGDACTDDSLTGSAGNCDASCDYDAITACVDGDGCCPGSCNDTNDNDCVVIGIDPASSVTTTSQCLTSGTNAEAAIVVNLVDTTGAAVTGATVQIASTGGRLGSVTEIGGGEYAAILQAPLTMSGSTTVSVTADGVALTTEPVVSFEDPMSDLDGGSGGCPLDNNVRVRVVDGAGTPLANAFVMLGDSESGAAFTDTYGGSANAANTARTDSNGYAEFTDYGGNLTGTVTVTGVQTDYHYLTIVDGTGSDYVLPVELIDPLTSRGTYTGALTPLPAPNNSPIELGVMLPDLQLEELANFSLDSLLAQNKCYSAGGSVGDVAVPGNIYIPQQCALNLFGCFQNLPETDYISPPMEYGQRKLLGVSGDTPLSAISGGDIAAALTQLSLSHIGVVDRNVNAAGPQPQDITLTESLLDDVSCAVSNAPGNSDVFCVTAGDWDSGADNAIGPGEGRLSITGFSVDTFAGGTLNITNVARPPLQNDFASLETVGAAAALYLDDASAPSADVANGVSAIFDRGADFGSASNRALTFDDFFALPSLDRTGRTLTRGSVANGGGTQPAANYTIHTITRDVTTTFTACDAGDSSTSESFTLWKIWAPETSTSFDLPTPPATFPNGGTGDLAGLIDTATTPEDDALSWLSLTVHEGLRATAFSWGDVLFSDFRRYTTHVGANSEVY